MSRRCAIVLVLLASAQQAAAGDWVLTVAPDPQSYRDVAVLHREAERAIEDEYRTKAVHPRLEFRCEPGRAAEIRVRIDWRRFISSFNTPVEFRAGDAETLTVTLGVDRSNKVTSTQSADDDRRLLDYLQGRTSLSVGVTPYSEVPLSVDYELAGFDERLAALREACAN